MQEFTLPSNQTEQETPQQPENTTQRMNIPQQLQNMATAAPQNQGMQQPASSTGTSINCRLVFAIMIFVMIIILGIIFGFLYFRSDEDGDVLGTVEEIAEDTDSSSDSVPAPLINKIIYHNGYNIFISDKDGSNPKQLTSYKVTIGSMIYEVELINNYLLGFIRCSVEDENYLCSIVTYDLIKEEEEKLKDIPSEIQIENLTWVNLDRFAYTSLSKENRLLGINLIDKNIPKIITGFKIPDIKRDDFIEDDNKLVFSPDGSKLLYINTNSQTGFDFTTYIYDLNNSEVHTIYDATKPTWKDNQTIIYRKYSNSEAGPLYQYHLGNKQSEKLVNMLSASYDPNVLGKNLVFWEASSRGKSYLYDLYMKKQVKIADESAYPIWLSNSEIIIAKTRKCEVNECTEQGKEEYESQLKITGYALFNLETSETIDIKLSENDIEDGMITWFNRHP